jgi:hypothetical protein
VCAVVSEGSVLSSPPHSSKQAIPRRRPMQSSGHRHCTGFASSRERGCSQPDAWRISVLAASSTPVETTRLQPHFKFHPLIASTHHLTSPASIHRPAFLLFLCHLSFHKPRPPTPSSSPPRCSSPPVAIHSRHLNSTRATTYPPCRKAYNRTRSYSTMTRKRPARSASRSSTSPTRASSLVLVATRFVPRAAHCDPRATVLTNSLRSVSSATIMSRIT